MQVHPVFLEPALFWTNIPQEFCQKRQKEKELDGFAPASARVTLERMGCSVVLEAAQNSLAWLLLMSGTLPSVMDAFPEGSGDGRRFPLGDLKRRTGSSTETKDASETEDDDDDNEDDDVDEDDDDYSGQGSDDDDDDNSEDEAEVNGDGGSDEDDDDGGDNDDDDEDGKEDDDEEQDQPPSKKKK